MFKRVIPRDLFNEAKLLKCLGQLSLLLHDGVGIRWPLRLRHKRPEKGFRIDQRAGDAGLFCVNLNLSLNGRKIVVFSSYNSKEPYPLLFEDWEGGEGEVFDASGQFSTEFMEWLDRQTETPDNAV